MSTSDQLFTPSTDFSHTTTTLRPCSATPPQTTEEWIRQNEPSELETNRIAWCDDDRRYIIDKIFCPRLDIYNIPYQLRSAIYTAYRALRGLEVTYTNIDGLIEMNDDPYRSAESFEDWVAGSTIQLTRVCKRLDKSWTIQQMIDAIQSAGVAGCGSFNPFN